MSNQQQEWGDLFGQMNEAVAESFEKNLEAQSAMMESWMGSFEDSVPDDEVMGDGMEGMAGAYEVWMSAAEEMFERTTDAAQGDDVAPQEFRDIWLRSANEAFSEVLSTTAFAHANGQLVEQVMEMQEEMTEMTEDQLATMGIATNEDVQEVGERLIELERRQHTVEQKLDQILDALEE
ncbi:poly(R)-hydroxyalkanoic acid synthase subunit PhaE [Halovenus halobia]|uniref:poly(R)-hydroxyalkanoic acid synthase subunit PhaE n=1 Tax=Halovenus halobia TaxID=3396622 RepID=UPI003F57AC12